jgi:nicotinamide mononucleotide (NMN) deamidase PncC
MGTGEAGEGGRDRGNRAGAICCAVRSRALDRRGAEIRGIARKSARMMFGGPRSDRNDRSLSDEGIIPRQIVDCSR